MISLSIQEPKIEHFFKHSQEEMIKALRFIVEHEIDYGESSNELSVEQKKELTSRIESYHNDRSIGKSWSDIKSSLLH
ncbi:MAG: hypothetical protein V2A75_05300 [Pseudomonadota bacterium]